MSNDWPNDIDGTTWTLFDALGRELERDVTVYKHGPFMATVNINGKDYMRAELVVSEDCRRIDSAMGWYLTR